MTPAGVRRYRGPMVAAMVVVGVLLLSGGGPWSGPPPARGASAPEHLLPAATPVPTRPLASTPIGDGGSLRTVLGSGGHSTLSDSVSGFSGAGGSRGYAITLTATVALPTTSVNLSTDPVTEWADPLRIPGGPDALPGFSDWSWAIRTSQGNDTANWTGWGSAGTLSRTVPWENASFVVDGTVAPTVGVTFNHTGVSNELTPGAGFSMNSPALGSRFGVMDPNVAGLTSALRPTMIRAGLTALGTVTGWNNTTGTGSYSFGALDWFLGFARNLSSEVYLSLPAGTWGDGNQLPPSMPLNATPIVNPYGTPGGFPTAASYGALVRGIALHVAAAGESVAYWNIGNEVPVSNTSLLNAFVAVFNAAAQSIHSVLPNARVGSDVMTDPAVLPSFASGAHGVGFLAFHFYPSQTVCTENGSVCPAGQGGDDLTDAAIWNSSAGYAHLRSIALGTGQREWHNLTGEWVPVLDAESNLDTAGGSPLTAANGTDPRQQTLLGAAWTDAMLVDAAASNVSRFNYYGFQGPSSTPNTVTGPVGGWGFGLVSLGTQGNVTRFAPWWGMEMWGQNIPAGVRPHPTAVTDPVAARALAVSNGTGDAAIVVNTVDVPVRFVVTDVGVGSVSTQVEVLDASSFVTALSLSGPRLTLLRSGVTWSSGPVGDAATFVIEGYGVAVVLFGGASGGPSNPPAPPLISSSEFLGATILGVGLLVAVTVVVVLPRRRGPRPPTEGTPSGSAGPLRPDGEPPDDEL